MEIEDVWMSREEMSRYVARFNDLKGSDEGLPDSTVPGHYKYLYSVVGFRAFADPTAVSPVGEALSAAVQADAGYSIGYTRCPPNNGPAMHNHNTFESFIILKGTWRIIWESSPGVEAHEDLGPLDIFVTPPGVPRRFYNLTPGEGDEMGLLMAVTGGDSPAVTFTDEVRDFLVANSR